MTTSRPAPILEARRVTKSFGPIEVLHGVDFALRPGEVHALVGENGAGKSTLMKCLAGYQPVSGGEIALKGEPVVFADSEAAENAGVVLIHQEFNLAEQLSAEENVFLGRELKRGLFLDRNAMRAKAESLLKELATPIDTRLPVSKLSVSQKQMVEIAKALVRNARVLIMDEPTAVLTGREAEVLFAQIARLKAEGVAILYTSHKLDEIARIADEVTVLRDGSLVESAPAATMNPNRMAELMVGRELSDLFPEKLGAGDRDVVLAVRDFSVPGHVETASFELHRGEILGFAGLVGAGRTELMEGIMGLRPASGMISRNGETVRIRDPKEATRQGLAYLTEDRKGRGLLLRYGLRENLTLLGLDRFSGIFVDEKAEEEALDAAICRFDIRAGSRTMPVGNLSGGNQQKLLLAKTMLVEPEIVILDEPTRGIDIGTKQQIYAFINELAREGRSVIVISSEMTEVIGLSDRVIVMRSGRIAGEVSGADITEEAIVRRAMGLEVGERTEMAGQAVHVG
ncbi:sugar ABC transporter ATP-binding protein [Jiella avicenniae]|uniref:Sugar ABC transporter ATP-binding protein n=1 Tax=Jiella avicenniae TaxID=2907202 RepID=A0A9X1P5Z7_9HYPH|nr:sugar ABC transporter ATP-binding protein [Jiella avicenniae]MCE7029913.1 sugar ABC transporter ATP-binding protein [Jiella avicenniae]